jgi:RecA/RadA recombinase
MAAFKGCPPGKGETGHPKIMVSGKSGEGKTWFATSFPKVFYIDTEAGGDLPRYQKRLAEAGGWYMGRDHGALDYDTVIEQVKLLATTKHEYKTLVIDSFTKLYNTAAGIAEETVGNDYGRDKKEANKPTRKLLRWLDKLDMNAILICHAKAVWMNNQRAPQDGYDAWDKLEYELHLWLEVQKQGNNRVAVVRKSRLEGFEHAARFPLTYGDFAQRYGKDYIEAEVKAIELATPEQVTELRELIDLLRVDEATVAKWMEKAGAEELKDMSAEVAGKCIAALNAKLPQRAA